MTAKLILCLVHRGVSFEKVLFVDNNLKVGLADVRCCYFTLVFIFLLMNHLFFACWRVVFQYWMSG